MITGTFLDEISHDIPSANWGRLEWAKDFESMASAGIDTVILIRAGYRDRCAFHSDVLRKRHGYLIVQDDLVELFLDLAQTHGMTFWFGTYDSGEHWVRGEHQAEIDVNLAFTEEFAQRYGDHPALGGWYISHEIDAFDDGVMRVYESLARHLKGLRDLPILISPYPRGAKQFDRPFTLEEHSQHWSRIFERIEGLVDVVAFQDGQVLYSELPDYLATNADLSRRHGITSWSNVESFDRDVHLKFPPIAWPKLRYKIEAARAAQVDKLITFEYSHFMSPNSMFPSAAGLHRMYMEWKRGEERRG
ncbi:hypothetical protein Poly30_22720 [Planctomycetes bacterium Poly30]|uniref:DUF4434 domain-containing protein n=1 Tax=Saltatorellus ferox TaxID=2528018 RepID=A0A518ERQ2_9BACT|nr:hypothetical protein Poly30_22720 [Planctomycetes bacterium Poly30]